MSYKNLNLCIGYLCTWASILRLMLFWWNNFNYHILSPSQNTKYYTKYVRLRLHCKKKKNDSHSLMFINAALKRTGQSILLVIGDRHMRYKKWNMVSIFPSILEKNEKRNLSTVEETFMLDKNSYWNIFFYKAC